MPNTAAVAATTVQVPNCAIKGVVWVVMPRKAISSVPVVVSILKQIPNTAEVAAINVREAESVEKASACVPATTSYAIMSASIPKIMPPTAAPATKNAQMVSPVSKANVRFVSRCAATNVPISKQILGIVANATTLAKRMNAAVMANAPMSKIILLTAANAITNAPKDLPVKKGCACAKTERPLVVANASISKPMPNTAVNAIMPVLKAKYASMVCAVLKALVTAVVSVPICNLIPKIAANAPKAAADRSVTAAHAAHVKITAIVDKASHVTMACASVAQNAAGSQMRATKRPRSYPAPSQ